MGPGDFLVEAHHYSGGLRHTAFTAGVPRPDWVPPPDSVGWRDDFALERDDAVIEFVRREHRGAATTWLAVYKPSFDAQLGDRRNHAGIGVWLRRHRIADARTLLLALEQYTTTLAANPDPAALEPYIAEFASDRFLATYLVAADLLPSDWTGVPPATGALVRTGYALIRASRFVDAIDRAIDPVTRLSLGWSSSAEPSRMIVLTTPRTDAPAEREFVELDPPGGFLAEIIKRVPVAFEGPHAQLQHAVAAVDRARDEVRRDRAAAEALIASQREAWRSEQEAQRQAMDDERRKLQSLDGHPPSLEGIAARLNALSNQVHDVGRTMTRVEQQARASRDVVIARPPVAAEASPASVQSPAPTREETHWAAVVVAINLALAVATLVVILLGFRLPF